MHQPAKENTDRDTPHHHANLEDAARQGRIRAAILLASLILAGLLVGAWWIVREGNRDSSSPSRTSVLDQNFDGSGFASDATAEQLLELATGQIDRLLEEYPRSSAAHHAKANRDYLLSDTASAKVSWLEAADLDPMSVDAMYGLALLAFEEGHYEEAIGLCDQISSFSSGNPRVPLLQADAFLHDGQPLNAALTLEQHLAQETASVQALEMLGNAYIDTENFTRAAATYERALAFAPDSKDALYGMGKAQTRLGNRDAAKSYMERFSKLARESSASHSDDAKDFQDRNYAAHVAAQVYVDSALIYKNREEFSKARDSLLRAQKLQPDVIAWLEELQRVCVLQGDKWGAADVGQHLVSLDSSNLEYHLNLGQLYAELEQSDLAIATFQAAITLAPNDPRCQRAQQVIQQLKDT